MSDEKEPPVEITRKGTWPVFKYVVRLPRYYRACVMIDDDIGDILVSFDDDALQHFWGKEARGEPKLRQFLVRAGIGYLKDKFSYGRNRFNLDQAQKALEEAIEEALKEGKIDEDEKEDIRSSLSNMFDANNVSSDYFYSEVMNCQTLMEKVFENEYENLPRGEGDNREARWFIERAWPHLVEQFKKELAEET